MPRQQGNMLGVLFLDKDHVLCVVRRHETEDKGWWAGGSGGSWTYNEDHIRKNKVGHVNDIFLALQDEMGRWADTTFPESTFESKLAHLYKEYKELKKAQLQPHKAEESADMVLLLIHLAHEADFNLFQRVLEKFLVNKTRTWGKPDEDGVVEHVRPTSPSDSAPTPSCPETALPSDK